MWSLWSLIALVVGFIIDMLVGDPLGSLHPVVWIGKLISFIEKQVRQWFPKTNRGERVAGMVLWLIVCSISTMVPAIILWGLRLLSPWLALAAETIMCWQILAAKSLKKESMKVYDALKQGDIEKARQAVSMIVGRDTERLDEAGIIRAAVETVAENTSDGVIAPILFILIGGAPFGFLYKAVNTMDSMLGYTDPPYTNIGLIPARADDVFNFIPARISALLMMLAGAILDVRDYVKSDTAEKARAEGRWRYPYFIRNGWRIFFRDRYKHASPNSGQTESVCAGLLGVQLAGDAWYHGVLHTKPFIGDPLREISIDDIPLTGRLMYAAAVATLAILGIAKMISIIPLLTILR